MERRYKYYFMFQISPRMMLKLLFHKLFAHIIITYFFMFNLSTECLYYCTSFFDELFYEVGY